MKNKRTDTERLDWLILNKAILLGGGLNEYWIEWIIDECEQDNTYATERDAIDAAMKVVTL